MTLRRRLVGLAAAAGYEVHRHPARRRARMLEHHEVDLVIDVGAATGLYGLDLRRHGYRGRIVSFEPLLGPFEELAVRARRDGRWDAANVALGATAGTATLNVAGNSDSSSFLPMLPRHVQAAAAATYVGTHTVDVTTLDDAVMTLLDRHRRPFLKLDVQGFEREVLMGGASTLPRLVGLQLELSLVPLYEGGMLYDEAVCTARSAGFALRGIEPGFIDEATGELLQADGIFFRE